MLSISSRFEAGKFIALSLLLALASVALAQTAGWTAARRGQVGKDLNAVFFADSKRRSTGRMGSPAGQRDVRFRNASARKSRKRASATWCFSAISVPNMAVDVSPGVIPIWWQTFLETRRPASRSSPAPWNETHEPGFLL